jgi:hypothetical protein
MMKKLISMLSVLSATSIVHALPVGNPAEPGLFSNGCVLSDHSGDCDPCFNIWDAFSLRIGFYGDYVFNRSLKFKFDALDPTAPGRKIDEVRVMTNAGYLALNFFERFDLFTTLGGTRISEKTNLATGEAVLLGEGELIYHPHFSWSVGGRSLLFSFGCFDLGIEGQYFRSEIRSGRVIDYVAGLVRYRDFSCSSAYQEWQFGGGIALHFATPSCTQELVPYVGVKGSWVKFVTVAEGERIKYINDKNVGFVTGMTLTLVESVGVTVEGRFGDELALSVLGEFRF